MAQLTVSIITHDEEFKRQAAQLLRACGVPIGILEPRAGTETSTPDIALVDIRADASSGMAAIERLRAAQPGMAIFAIAAGAEPDLILQAMRAGRERVLPVDAGRRDPGVPLDGGVVPRRGPAHGGAPRGRDRRHQAAVCHARLPRRQGRRRDDDRRRELRGGTGAADEAADGDRRPQDLPRRGGPVPRRAAALHRPRRDREPASPRQGLPQGAGVAAQVRPRHRRRVGAVRPAERPGRRRDRGAAADPDADLRLRDRGRRQHDQLVRHRGALCRRHRVPGDQPGRAVDPQRAAAGRAGAAARGGQRAGQDPAQPRLGEPADRAEADRDGARLRRSTTRSRATIARCPRRSTPACR